MGNGSRQDEELAMWERAPSHVAFRASRTSISSLIQARPEVAERIVPACPEWTVRDLLAHVVGNTRSSYRGGRSLPPIHQLGISELLDEWELTGPAAEQTLADKGGFNRDILVMDLFTHELDLRRVVEVPAPDDHPAYPTAMGVVLGGFTASIFARGLPGLRLEADGAQWTAGWGTPKATVRAHRFDLYRSIAGRRTHQQIAQLSWSAPADRWLPAFTWGPFNPPAQASEDVIGIDDYR